MPTSIFDKYKAYEEQPQVKQENVFDKYKQYEAIEQNGPEPVFKNTTLKSYKPNLLEQLIGLNNAQKVTTPLQSAGQSLYSGYQQMGSGVNQLSETLTSLGEKYGPDFLKPYFAKRKEQSAELKKEYQEKAQKSQEIVQKMPFNEMGQILDVPLQQVPRIALALPTGSLAPVVYGTTISGQYMEEAANEGATPEQQLAYGTIMGAVEGVTEISPFKTMNKIYSSAGKKALLSYLKNIPEEGIQEAVSQIASGITKTGIYKPDELLTDGKVDWSKVQKLGAQSIEAGGQGALTATLMGAPGAAISGLKQSQQSVSPIESVIQKTGATPEEKQRMTNQLFKTVQPKDVTQSSSKSQNLLNNLTKMDNAKKTIQELQAQGFISAKDAKNPKTLAELSKNGKIELENGSIIQMREDGTYEILNNSGNAAGINQGGVSSVFDRYREIEPGVKIETPQGNRQGMVQSEVAATNQSILRNDKISPVEEIISGQDNTIQTEGTQNRDTGYGRFETGSKQIDSQGGNRPGYLGKNQEIMEPPKNKAVSVTPMAQRYIQKAGFKNAEEAHIAFESKQKGREWFKNEFGNIDNPEAVYNELVSKADKLTPQEQKKVKFDLQFFAMREPNFNKNVKDKFISDRPISRARTNTFERAINIPDDVKAEIGIEPYAYDQQSSKKWQDEAEANVKRDRAGIMKKLFDAESISGGVEAHEAAILTTELAQEASRTKDYAEVNRFTQMLATKIRETGRALKGWDTGFEKTSPEGALIKAQKMVHAVEQEIKKTNAKTIEKINQETKQVKRIIDQTKKELKAKSKEQILNEIRRKLQNSLKEKPSRKTQNFYDKVIELVRAGAYDDTQIRDLIKQKEGLPVLTAEDTKFIIEHMDKANSLPQGSGEQLREIYRVQKLIEDKSQATIHDKVRGVMQISLLGRVKTFVRNTVANPIFGGVERISETTNARLANYLFDKVSKDKLGQQFSGRLVNKEFFKGAKGGLKNVIDDIGGGWDNWKALSDDASIVDKLKAFEKDWMNRTDTSISRGQADLVKKRVFKNEFMQSALDAIGYMLKIGDEPFVQGWKKQRLAELKQLHKTDTVTPEMEAEAILYALDKTFQNDSGAKEALLTLRRVANKYTGIGGDVILPFAATPANIIDKTFEYTPAGLIKIVRDYGRMKRGDERFNPRVFVQRMGRAMTGTELLILGGVLFKAGILSGGGDKESEKERKFKQMSGEQDYSFKLGRQRYSYDWTDPIGTILATGADMAKNIEDAKDWAASITALFQTTVNTLARKSFLQSINRLTGYGDLGKGIQKTALGVPGMFMPGTVTQFSPMADEYARDTSDKNPLKETGKQLVSKIPFASKTLPPQLDLFGNPVKSYGGENNPFNVLINPGRYSKTSNAPAIKLISDLYKRTGEKEIIPKVAPEKLTYDNQTIQLTPEERRRFQKVMGQKIQLDLMLFSGRAKTMTDEEQVKEIKKLIDKAYDVAKEKLLQEKNIPLKTSKSKKSSSGLLGWS
jgi:hypothetical protein